MTVPPVADPHASVSPETTPPGSTAGETLLLERLRAGDGAAFDDLVRTHAGPLLAVARRILSSEEDARDAVQEAFFSAFRSLHGFRHGSRLSTWLHRITVNCALMQLRSSKRRGEREIEELLPTFDESGHRVGASLAAESCDPEREVTRAEVRARVRQAIHELPSTYRVVLLLRHVEELSTRETAELLKITETAVKLRLHRARQALQKRLEPLGAAAPAA